MGIRDRPIAARSPWQNAYAERLIGSMRREAANAWTTSLFLASATCGVCSQDTRFTTVKRARIGHFRRMRHCGERSRKSVTLQEFQSWADYIINTSGYSFWKAQVPPS
jgi:hypothetical protein